MGSNGGTITASYATGPVSTTGAYFYVGGLVGEGGTITASYATGPVSANGDNSWVGGLVGGNSGPIAAAYSRSPVKATGNNAKVGGLVGQLSNASITASYAMGPVVATGANTPIFGKSIEGSSGGLVGKTSSGKYAGTAVDSYWDTDVSGQSSSALGTGVGGSALNWYGTPGYSGRFANWNLNLDGVAGKDDPWLFANGLYPMLKYGGHDVIDQLQLRIWGAPAVGQVARTHWNVQRWLTKVPGQGHVWERSDDGFTGWTVVRDRQAGIGSNRYDDGLSRLLIEPYEANKRFRVRRQSVERGWLYSFLSQPAAPWSGPTATLTFASGHTTPRVGQAIAITGTNNVRWIRCDDTADKGCEVIVRAATGYTPVAADQGKYLYAYR